MNATATIAIARPIGDVFAYITDVSNMPAWISGVQSARLLTDEMDANAHYVVDYNGGWRSNEIEVEVTRFEPPNVFASVAVRGPFAFEGTIRLEPIEGGGTRVSNVIDAGPDSVASRVASIMLGWLLRGSMSRRLLRELETLQGSIEGDPSLRT